MRPNTALPFDAKLSKQSTSSRANNRKPRSHNRHQDLLLAAAQVFRDKGYAQATMRDIALASGMIAGSIYYHYAAKSDLLLAVYTEGVRLVSTSIDEILASSASPVVQLERAVLNHLEMMLGTLPGASPFASVFIQVQPHDFPKEGRQALIELRHSYENKFKTLIARLALRRGTDKSLLRLQLIGALNHVPIWYKADGRKSLNAIAKAMTAHVRWAMQDGAD
ncbi:MAG: TetR/AcrR family transcriptional regulator [Betaproteobacteria bacterium]|nr:TetR/AcrR family transcriptional regulator [Betaproteobacteria bacterium]NBY05447.1 TetR/AcrR family transcriptional regulator [Betaproteobacteria bacterium]